MERDFYIIEFLTFFTPVSGIRRCY